MKRGAFVAAIVAIVSLAGCSEPVHSAGGEIRPVSITKENGLVPVKNAVPGGKTELATFAAGCFWGVEQVFREQKGVVATSVGYTGGHTQNPTYREVCGHGTGHAEAVLVEFDPAVVSYEQLLKLFWDIHDPTTLNRQGPDVGDQYRSAIFYHGEAQKKAADVSRDKLAASGELRNPIVTQIVPAVQFYPAEEYHQQYVEKGGIAFCHRRK